MSFERQNAAALRILDGLESGSASTADSVALLEEADPALVYLIFTWIRRRYADDPSGAVIARLVAVADKSPAVAAKMKSGQSDPVVQWFEDEHQYRTLGAREFIELVVDKLEG
ncbi:MAG: hypothetical protein JNM17_38935 [Archangium sp.]|nr:hypothetical protein [Archangium sp.]